MSFVIARNDLPDEALAKLGMTKQSDFAKASSDKSQNGIAALPFILSGVEGLAMTNRMEVICINVFSVFCFSVFWFFGF
jgi:hypothetical protein